MRTIQVIRHYGCKPSVGYIQQMIIRYTPEFEQTTVKVTKNSKGDYLSMFIVSAIFAIALITMLNQKGF